MKAVKYLIIAAGWSCLAAFSLSASHDDVPRITVQELKEKMDRHEDIVVLDIRSEDAYAGSTVRIPGAIRMPLDQVGERYRELPQNREIVTYCT
ncbi:MAG: rhodanese-like domain-containing protein [Syntrophales bacterium]